MNKDIQPGDVQVTRLGECRFPSPLKLSTVSGDGLGNFVTDARRVRLELEFDAPATGDDEPLAFEKAGPRELLFFEPGQAKAAIVTCGGLCPGINNVIRSIYFELTHNYGVPEVCGVRNGFQGFDPQSGAPPMEITPESIEEIHKLGGTILGSSRGPQLPAVIVDFLEQRGVNILFCVGGDGTQRGAQKIFEEVQRRKKPIAIVGVPKTIDNDIMFVDRTFGFLTALEEAQHVLRGAHVEARGAARGVSLVKLMGRNAGFIAAGAALASQEANFVLVPEVNFRLDGERGLLAALEARVQVRDHAVVVVAEGAGQHLLPDAERPRDASGNLKHGDVGDFLRRRIIDYFRERGAPISMKYIDPSYTIRSVPANCYDRLLCDQFARRAVHAAMTGKTGVMIGLQHATFVHVPIATAIAQSKTMDVEGDLWTNVLLATGQPRWGSMR